MMINLKKTVTTIHQKVHRCWCVIGYQKQTEERFVLRHDSMNQNYSRSELEELFSDLKDKYGLHRFEAMPLLLENEKYVSINID